MPSLLTILEKEYGNESQVLLSSLSSQANALRSLGRTDEVAKIDQRIKSIQAAAQRPN